MFLIEKFISNINLGQFSSVVEWNSSTLMAKNLNSLCRDPHFSWVCHKPTNIELHVDLPFECNLSKLTFYAWKYPPSEIDVFYSSDKREWIHFGKLTEMRSNQVFPVELAITTRYLKLVCKGRKKSVGTGSCRLNLVSIYGLPSDLKNLITLISSKL